MNKYTLTFKDKQFERDYQQKSIPKQYNALKIITATSIITVSIRGIQAIFQNEFLYIAHFLSISFYLIFQLLMISQKKQYVRAALTLLNNLLGIYTFSQTKVFDTQMAMMLGINQMALTILLLLSVEFIEGVITIFNLTVFRVVWTITHSNELQFAALFSQFLLFYYICYFNYQFHKGKRSQFILQNVNSNWEEIIKKLLVKQPYLIIQFQEESLNFTITNNHCEQILQNCEKNQKEFLQQSVVEGKSLKNYLFQEIVKCKNQDYKPIEVILNYQKRSYLIEMSIYQMGDLNLLLIFKDFDQIKLFNNCNQIKRNTQLCHIILQIVKKLIKLTKSNIQYCDLQRKIIILYLYENLKINCEYRNTLFNQLLEKVVYYCSNLKINLYLSVPVNQTIQTHPKLFMMAMLIIFDNSLQSNASISCKIDKNKDIKIYLKGNFNYQVIENIMKPYKRKFEILFKDTQFNKNLITLIHKSEILVPFQIND